MCRKYTPVAGPYKCLRCGRRPRLRHQRRAQVQAPVVREVAGARQVQHARTLRGQAGARLGH